LRSINWLCTTGKQASPGAYAQMDGGSLHQLALNTFIDSACLKVNYSKSNMFPINIAQERLLHLAATFNCQVGAFPFTCLGLAPQYE
jgi:hypothetical protein